MLCLDRSQEVVESIREVKNFAKIVMNDLALALAALNWEAEVGVAAGEVEATRPISLMAEHTVSFTIIHNKSDVICFQPGIGIRLHEVNKVISELRGSNRASHITGYILVNHLMPSGITEQKKWCLKHGSSGDLERQARLMAEEVVLAPEVQMFYRSVIDVNSYMLQ
jgi:hypothetical protein